MDKMKIVSIVGARPQFVKMALVAEAAGAFRAVDFCIAHTGQHYDANMSDIFFRDLDIPSPKYNLNIGSGTHVETTGKMLQALERVLLKEAPDMVFVYGDTNSTLAGALAAVKMGIPLAHIEAGLRSFNRSMPEEINRLITDRVSDILFCPTKTAVHNLRREGITKGVFQVEDVMIEMLRKYSAIAGRRSRILGVLSQGPHEYYLATVHRACNTDDIARLKSLLKTFGLLKRPVIFPVHPRTTKAISANKIRVRPNVIMIDPVSYIDMLMLEKHACAILTDSGGMQKEAHFFHVPCVTLREETEWVETVSSGWNVLAGADEVKIRKALKHFSSPRRNVERRPARPALNHSLRSGSGQASPASRMIEIALKFLRSRR